MKGKGDKEGYDLFIYANPYVVFFPFPDLIQRHGAFFLGLGVFANCYEREYVAYA